MAWQDMDVVPVNTGYQRDVCFQKEITLMEDGTSDWIVIPDQINDISVTISFTGGAAGKVQTTTDSLFVIKNGSPYPVDWPYGVVNYLFKDSCYPVSGMRIIQIGSGTMRMTMRAQ